VLLSDDRVRRLRTGAQLLHRPARRSVVALVKHLTGVQAQVLSAAGLALRARTKVLTSARVDRARLRDRSIVLTWAMRGTLHLIAAEDYGWLVPLTTEPGLVNAYRRLNQEEVPADQPAKAVRLISRMLEREGPLTRAEIADRLQRKGIRVAGQAIAHLVWLAAAQGVICYGPDQRFALVADWLGEPKPREHDAALAELAVRYLRSHGPAGPADLAYWSGIRASDATRAWKSIAGRLEEVETARGARWMLRANQNEAPKGVVRLLPAFDEYLLGWKDREVAVSNEHRANINRGGGWLHPVLLVDGRLVATWGTEKESKRLRIDVVPFAPLTPTVKRAVAAEANDIGDYLGISVVLGS
jgi:hypothetical protein